MEKWATQQRGEKGMKRSHVGSRGRVLHAAKTLCTRLSMLPLALPLALPSQAYVALESFLRTAAVRGGGESWALVLPRSKFEFQPPSFQLGDLG